MSPRFTIIMTSLLVFILLSLTGTIYALPMDVGDAIERANINMGRARGGPRIEFGDIAMPSTRNAVPCTQKGCLWPRHWNGNVYIAVTISNRFSRDEWRTVIRGLVSFHSSTCIRFVWRRYNRDYLQLYPGTGCWSYVGRQGGPQKISLQSRGCVSQGTIQHEVLHALGFTHEQNRSDRDDHVNIVTGNIRSGKEHNFRKVATNNLATPYDYNSVMHYSRYAFSKQWGRLATIVPKPDPSVSVGGARSMSTNDIARVNKLYCSN